MEEHQLAGEHPGELPQEMEGVLLRPLRPHILSVKSPVFSPYSSLGTVTASF